MIALKRVLVATDFSEAADTALRYGRALARNFGAELVLLHMAEDITARLFAGEGYGAMLPEVQANVEAVARKQLDERLVDNDPKPLPAAGEVITSSAPAATIVTYAKDHRIDLIVLGTHGRGGFAHMLMGSVAERVVRTAGCPVMVVRHPGHDFVVPDTLVAASRA